MFSREPDNVWNFITSAHSANSKLTKLYPSYRMLVFLIRQLDDTRLADVNKLVIV